MNGEKRLNEVRRRWRDILSERRVRQEEAGGEVVHRGGG